MEFEDWLELSEAAKILGVHPSTLRRWADAGKVAHMRTLNGRRRFDLATIQAARKMMQQSPVAEVAGKLEAKALDFARLHKADMTGLHGSWTANLNDEQLLLFRYSGQRLLGLMLQFISRNSGGESFLEEARHVAADYGLICYKAGLSLAQMTEAFLHFRRPVLQSVQSSTGLSGPLDRDGQRILLRTSDFFDALLVATIESYTQLNNKNDPMIKVVKNG
jgi:excisionase family DNA binding protein